MVAIRSSSLAQRAVALLLATTASYTHAAPAVPVARDETSYTANTVAAIAALQSWYDTSDGQWDTTGWWNSANCLQVLADFASIDATNGNKLGLGNIMSNTFTAAQGSSRTAVKSVDAQGLMRSTYTRLKQDDVVVAKRQNGGLLPRDTFTGFINDYYDDEGWWALALIRSYDVTREEAFFTKAKQIWADMQGGVDSTCGGGIWWSKDRNYKNAIANELYLAVAAALANREPEADRRNFYIRAAAEQWAWFRNSSMINSDGTINDGLDINADGSCTNNGRTAWSYNQGVVLGGLVELNRAQGGSDSSLLPAAASIATAAIKALSQDNILHESCESGGGNCGGDGKQFKGIFMRNLQYLYRGGVDATTASTIKSFILANAQSIWANDRNSTNYLGLVWSGPVTAGGDPIASTQSSAMDALVAAMAVTL